MEQMTPLSASFLQIEDEDRTATLAIASIAVFEGPAPDHEEFVAFITGRLPLVPRFRQKVRQVPFDLAAPAWVDDPDTDVGWHVRRTAVAPPGGPDELDALIGRVMSQRMDRRRPLWEYWVVEGLPDGQWAIIQKVHHCVVDGVSGTELYHVVFDSSPEPRAPVADDWVPDPAPGLLGITAQAVRDLAAVPGAAARAAGALLSAPRELAELAVQTGRGALTLGSALRPVASSTLYGPIGRQRRYTATTVSLSDVRTVKSAFGSTVNDVALAAVSGGFRALLLSRGEVPDATTVRTLVPVSLRQSGEESILDNRISMLLPYLPVDVVDPVARLREVRRRILDAAMSGEVEFASRLTVMARHEPFLPVALGVRLAFHVPQRQLVTVTTNVPGPRTPVYALGRRCLTITPYVPIANRMRFGVAMFSYLDHFAFGVTGDFDSGADIDVLAGGIADSVAELVEEAGEH